MVSQTQACYTASDGRRSYISRPYQPYFTPERRRYPVSLHSHDNHHSRALSMADPQQQQQQQQQLDSDGGTPQRKRIAVACVRCRKRKIRCSGDPGQGQPCSNCKNAGVEPCQFLRVASRETPFRTDIPDFGYNVGDARLYASRGPPTGIGYAQDLPTLGSTDHVLSSYRGPSSPYSSQAYTPTTKTYYPGISAYPNPYGDEFDYTGIPVPSQSILNPDPVQVGMPLPPSWSAGPGGRTKAGPSAYNTLYMDTDASAYSPYNNSGLVQRSTHPASMSPDGPSFSFSNVAASLPTGPSSGMDRLLPNPASRSSALPYPAGTIKHGAGGGADSYSTNGLDTSSMSYSTSQHSSSSRANSDAYSAASTQVESIFSDAERNALSSNGPAFDLSGAYTSSETRRDSHSGLGVGGGSSAGGSSSGSSQSSQSSVYAPAESAHQATHVTPQHHHHHHHAVHHAHAVAATHSVNGTATGGTSGGGVHVESRHVAVTTRH